ncbi:unnamed protein product [Ilex paraguariensis]|uniref:Uncharacterized protein n=1 Tax=Ilex paraguariensis TaxID=185542 RepID=A0ABC8TW89_9AQUA
MTRTVWISLGDLRAEMLALDGLGQVMTKMTELLGMPNVSDFYSDLARFDLQGIRKKMKDLVERFDRIFETMIDQRVKMDSATDKESKVFLQVLLQLKDEGDAKMPLTMTHLKALLMVRVLEHGVLAFRYQSTSTRI